VTTKRRILVGLGMGDGAAGGNIVVVPRIPTIGVGIEMLRKDLAGNHWLDNRWPAQDKEPHERGTGEDMGCAAGVKCLDGYQFEWDDVNGIFKQKPLHNWASHGCDAFRQHSQGYKETSSLEREDDDPYERRRKREQQRNWKTA
jgi:hypothetical protein